MGGGFSVVFPSGAAQADIDSYGIVLINGFVDPLCVRDFCAFCGYTETEFWAIMDKFYNRDLFEKDEYGRWMLKEPIWKEN